jgi:hypothetical protein
VKITIKNAAGGYSLLLPEDLLIPFIGTNPFQFPNSAFCGTGSRAAIITADKSACHS